MDSTPNDLSSTLTMKEYALADAQTSAKIGLPAKPHGMFFCVDHRGEHWTAVTDDVAYWEMARDAAIEPRSDLGEFELHRSKFPLTRKGWPDEWAAGNRASRRKR